MVTFFTDQIRAVNYGSGSSIIIDALIIIKSTFYSALIIVIVSSIVYI